MRNQKKLRYVICLNELLEILICIDEEKKILPQVITDEWSFSLNGNEYVCISHKRNLKILRKTTWLSIDSLSFSNVRSIDREAIDYFLKNLDHFLTEQEVLDSYHFVKALENKDIMQLSKIPKSDLHNHVPYGGNRLLVSNLVGKDIPKLTKRLNSIPEMNDWCDKYIKTPNDFCTRVRAAFVQAKQDGIKVFAPNIAPCAQKHFESFEKFMDYIRQLVLEFSEYMRIYPELCLDRHKFSDDLEESVIKYLDTGIFYSIDLTGDEKLGVKEFRKIYCIADEYGIVKKAHVGEFSNSESIYEAISILGLNCIQHGISATQDKKLVELIRERNISLTICPTSNYYLSRISDYKSHPIKDLFRSKVNVSICSDDALIFDSTVSSEYLRLYESNVLNPFELNSIRIFGLKFYD